MILGGAAKDPGKGRCGARLARGAKGAEVAGGAERMGADFSSTRTQSLAVQKAQGCFGH